MPVAVMRQVLTNKEFHGWLAYFQHAGPDVQEIQMATLSLMVAQGLGAKKVEHSDYMIRKQNKPKTKAQKATTPDGVLTQNEVMSVFAGIATPLDG
jgi:hypothetical protein